jgi:hypothetical protein
MKKLIIAAIAALGMGAAAAPASAGSSIHVSGFISAPAYTHSYTPYYGSSYYAPRYVAPRYYAPAPVISYSFGKPYYSPYRAHRKARRAARRAYRRALRRSHYNHW